MQFYLNSNIIAFVDHGLKEEEVLMSKQQMVLGKNATLLCISLSDIFVDS